MKETQRLTLLSVALDLFDGDGGAAGGDGGQTAGQSAGKGDGDGEVLYGRQPAADPAPNAGKKSPQIQTSSDSLEDRQRRYRELMSGEFRDLYDEDAKRLVSRSAREAAALSFGIYT